MLRAGEDRIRKTEALEKDAKNRKAKDLWEGKNVNGWRKNEARRGKVEDTKRERGVAIDEDVDTTIGSWTEK